jgi:N6-adenosine-specific RNA methylase IME4
MLPDSIEELTKFVLIGREKLTAVKAEIRAIDKIGLAKNVREQKNEEAQLLAGALLDAESKIGELLKDIPNVKAASGAGRCSLPEGITHKQSHFFQTLADNPEVVEQVKAEAKENDDLPTRTEVLRRVKEKDREEKYNKLKNNKMELPDNKYQVIYADPPWKYRDTCEEGSIQSKGADKHYPTMTIEELCNLDIDGLCSENAVLFLWTTAPLLKDSFEIINAWGFEYKTNFVWDKIKHNMGHYTSVRHEHLLIATKGSCTPDNLKLFDSVQSIERSKKHSEKPKEFYEIIETLYIGKKIELFARNKREGWSGWGNEL